MEKFSQFRDKGSGISPFIPVKTPLSALSSVFHAFLFLIRLPFFITYVAAYFLVLHHLPFLPVAARKILLWGMMGIPGIWWVDLQLDGVRRGTLAEQPPQRFPHPGSVIAANFTSPIDAIYLAAIFDPIFTVSYPNTRSVERISLLRAVLYALSPVRFAPRLGAKLTDLAALLERYPDRVVAVFPEATTTNGKGVLPFTPSLLAAKPDVHIFPVSIRYTPADVTTPVPGRWFKFLWDLLSRPTTCIRVRVAESILNSSAAQTNGVSSSHDTGSSAQRRMGGEPTGLSAEEQRVLDKVAEALARLCRNKRVGLTLRDKAAFVEAWSGRKK
ncbi:putative lysophosphatidic acid:oleoyl-CoA acyltransferase [Colletotrichum siamense]|uniref:Lysophosphatidic acid:oleoyl-CoA acyltransferase n=1 Tax=Colletotrichum siamense TaxID=690259 RepID=A0A9P5EU45_COLSI|nr:putative lysophosphatidic acid:oleoyl-CoA acyltransferase [Colletotrichum siamense]KAF4859465.1 putative lysophosphatidic acid:oleoyl-CoA acyltransferase [Colletotrichum siamense]